MAVLAGSAVWPAAGGVNPAMASTELLDAGCADERTVPSHDLAKTAVARPIPVGDRHGLALTYHGDDQIVG